MYKIHFIDLNNKLYEHCEFELAENEKLLDKLEEVLYIKQELTPLQPHRWKEDFKNDGKVLFTYHCIMTVVVSMENGIFTVVDR